MYFFSISRMYAYLSGHLIVEKQMPCLLTMNAKNVESSCLMLRFKFADCTSRSDITSSHYFSEGYVSVNYLTHKWIILRERVSHFP